MKKYLLFSLFFISSLNFPQTLIETVNLPAGNFWNGAFGMVYNSSKYWISSSWNTGGVANGIFYAVNSNGILVDTVDIDLPWIRYSQGLAYDGTDFWYVERKTARCDLYKVSTTGVVIDSIPTAELFGGATNIVLGGAGWDGSGLWISVYSPDTRAALYKVNVAARAIVDTISVIGLQPHGITVKGDTLFYVMDGYQGDDELIYAIDLNNENILFSFHVPETPGVRQSPRGLAWDGTYFWLLAEPVGASSGRQLFKYDLSGSGTPHISVPVSEIYFPNTTVGNTSNYNLIIYSNGTATLTIDSITISGNSFSFDPLSFPINIQPGNTQNVIVNFTPANYAFYQGIVKIYSNDPVNLIVNINLKGQGLLSGARIGLSATSHNFGNVWVGEEGIAFWKFKTFNMGDTPLEITYMSFDIPEFNFDAPSIPFIINSTDSVEITIYFYPTSTGTYVDSLVIVNSDITINQLAKIAVEGTGIFNEYNYGYTFWQYQVPDNPNTSSDEFRVEGLKPINDITGDGINEVIICTDNYWTICLDGAASGSTFPLWSFNTYFNNSNAGSIGQSWDYGVQDAVQIASDLNNDGKNDVVIGTGGGNEHVYALDGTNGEIIWQYGDDFNPYLGDFEAIDVQRDFNGDLVPDVLAIADGDNEAPCYHSAYLFNGTNGNIIWQYYYPGLLLAFGKSVLSIDDITGDGVPDAVISFGNNGTLNKSVQGLNGTNGNVIWTAEMDENKAKELLLLPLPSDSTDVIAGESFGKIHRLNGRTGEEVWSYTLGSLASVIQMSLIEDLNSDLIPDILIASFAGNGLNCLSGADGAQLWAVPMAYQYGVATIPDIDDDGASDVITGDQNGNVYIISGKTASLIFTHNYPGDRINTVNKMASIDGNFSNEILVGTKNGKVVCFSGGTVAVPVEFSTFIGNEVNGKIFLNWSTATETNNQGFEVQRTASGTHNLNWDKIGFVPGSGTTTELRAYSFIDADIFTGSYSYRLKQIDYNGNYEYSDVIEIEVGNPTEYSLDQNYPNPFNPSTKIEFKIPVAGLVNLKVYDILGREVTTLLHEEMQPGSYSIDVNAFALASGIYFYTLQAGEFVSTKKMVLLK